MFTKLVRYCRITIAPVLGIEKHLEDFELIDKENKNQ